MIGFGVHGGDAGLGDGVKPGGSNTFLRGSLHDLGNGEVSAFGYSISTSDNVIDGDAWERIGERDHDVQQPACRARAHGVGAWLRLRQVEDLLMDLDAG